jgi:hypothetical protein
MHEACATAQPTQRLISRVQLQYPGLASFTFTLQEPPEPVQFLVRRYRTVKNYQMSSASEAIEHTNDGEKEDAAVAEMPPTPTVRLTPRQLLQILGTFIVFFNTW